MTCILFPFTLQVKGHMIFDANRPYITPITLMQSRSTLKTWIDESKQFEPTATSKLVKSFALYDFHSTSTISCIALIHQHKVRVISLLEIINNRVILWNISVKPGEKEFASVLIKNMEKGLGRRLVIQPGYDNDRWKIARMYYRLD